MPKKCVHCDAELEKHHEVQINGVKYAFCPTRYSPLIPNCIAEYVEKNRDKIYQFCVISYAS
jgi:hypothetical protein